MPARVLVAPDSFKGTIPAWEVADACAEGLVLAGCEAELCPVADGGEGTMRILVEAFGGSIVPHRAADPLGRPIEAALGITGSEAIVEVAEASGLGLLTSAERDPERATTAGTGELILAARELGAERILVAAGGSATVDGGAGATEAIADAGGLGGCRLTVLCDVETPFEDAAAVYGPQKGASPEAVERLAKRLDRLAARLPRDPRGLPLTGAAGGLAGGLWATLGAELVPGAEYVLEALDFERRLERADAVIVGEGSLDAQSSAGKIVGHVARRAGLAGLPVLAIVGSNRLTEGEASELGIAGVRQASVHEEIVAAARALGESVGERQR